MRKKYVPINYTSRDYDSIKEDLVQYAKRYYPNTFQDFSEASFGALMLDTVAYIGDILSYYLDYQASESFLMSAIEYDNILKLGEQVGYKLPLSPSSHGTVAMYLIVPALPSGLGPNTDYAPVLRAGSMFGAQNGGAYMLTEDVDFSSASNVTVVAGVNNISGNPVSYAIKAYGLVMSGQISTVERAIGAFRRFREIEIEDENITEIVSVFDLEGHQYFEVPYLSQDTIFRPLLNKDPTSKKLANRIMKAQPVPRRFTTKNSFGRILLQFGYGSDDEAHKQKVRDPNEVVMNIHGREYETDESFDPSNLLSTDKLGIAPANTTLFITYRSNSSTAINAPVNTLTSVTSANFEFPSAATDDSARNLVEASLEVSNETPILGDVTPPTASELKMNINNVFATQNRAVTKQDYINLVYRMPSKFGKIKRCAIVQDHDSFKRNLNLYVVGEDENEHLTPANAVVKNNLKTWLNQYKMINDTIDILDGKVINISVSFTVVSELNVSKYDALADSLTETQRFFDRKFEMGEPLYVIDIYSRLNELDSVADVASVTIKHETGGIYSDNSYSVNDFMSVDGRILHIPEDSVFELKYQEVDIKGVVK